MASNTLCSCHRSLVETPASSGRGGGGDGAGLLNGEGHNSAESDKDTQQESQHLTSPSALPQKSPTSMPTTTYDTSCTCSCASDANQAYHRQAPDLNKALFKFSTSSMTRISAEIAQAWNNEPEQVKRDYEVQALRERQALELKTFPDYRYTKSSGAGAGSGPAGTHAEALTLALGSLSVKGGSGGGG